MTPGLHSLHALAPLLLTLSATGHAAMPDKQEIAEGLAVCQKAQEAECGHVPHLENACAEAVKSALGSAGKLE